MLHSWTECNLWTLRMRDFSDGNVKSSPSPSTGARFRPLGRDLARMRGRRGSEHRHRGPPKAAPAPHWQKSVEKYLILQSQKIGGKLCEWRSHRKRRHCWFQGTSSLITSSAILIQTVYAVACWRLDAKSLFHNESNTSWTIWVNLLKLSQEFNLHQFTQESKTFDHFLPSLFLHYFSSNIFV